MKNRLDFKSVDFRNKDVLGVNCLSARPFYCSYTNKEEAIINDKTKSDRYFLLNGVWKFHYQTNPFSSGVYEGEGFLRKNISTDEFFRENFNDDFFGEMPVPGHWQLNGYHNPHYNDNVSIFPIQDDIALGENPTGLYRHSFDYILNDSEEVLLRFDGVESAFHVWMNGEFVGYSQGSRLTSEFDVTDMIRNGKNTLSLKVYMFSDGSYLENQDMWWFAGIIRDVCLIKRPSTHIVDYFVKTKIQKYNKDDFTLADNVSFSLDVLLESPSKHDKDISVLVEILDGDERVFGQEFSNALIVDKGDDFIEKSFSFEGELKNIKLWSAEKPFLYDCVITVLGADEVVACKLGFREVENRNGVLYFNNKKLKLKGVNRHDWSCKSGRVVSEEDMRRDIVIMKASNINAVRTAHYPNKPLFYDLCDELGLYVMSEADIETNQMEWTTNYNGLSDNSSWEKAYLDRVRRLVSRDKNHASILFWSLGNESGYGINFKRCYDLLKSMDNTRLVHYEEDKEGQSVDVYSSMYTRIWDLEELGKINEDMPHIVCEYAHAMGNGPGSLAEYWEVFRRYDRLAGGFIWEWIDQSILEIDTDGNRLFKYGGDYGDRPNNSNFCADGIVQGDRHPTPALIQVKKEFEPVKVLGFESGKITLYNDYDFSTLAGIKLRWMIKAEGEFIRQGNLDIIELCQPKNELELELLPKNELGKIIDKANKELRIYIYIIKDDVEVAFKDFILKERVDEEHYSSALELKTERSGNELKISSPNYNLVFDLNKGEPRQIYFLDKILIKDVEGINFWRAPIDNDINARKIWEKSYLDLLTTTVDSVEWSIKDDLFVIEVKEIIAPFTLEYRWDVKKIFELDNNGININIIGVPSGAQLPKYVPKISYDFILDKSLDVATWYGRGLEESYSDSKKACPIDLYTLPVKDMYFPYVLPQENGQRSDCDYLFFFADKTKLTFKSKEKFSFSALYFSRQELCRATHAHKLEASEDVYLSINIKQRGLGSASWGQDVLEKYEVKSEPFDFCFRINIE